MRKPKNCTYLQTPARPDPCTCDEHRNYLEICPKCCDEIVALFGDIERDGFQEKCPLCGFILDGFDPQLHDYDENCDIKYYDNDDGTFDDRPLEVIMRDEEEKNGRNTTITDRSTTISRAVLRKSTRRPRAGLRSDRHGYESYQ